MTAASARIIPPLDDDKRYDVALVLPVPESTESIHNRILQAIQDYFAVIATREERLMDVYIVTTANGKPPTPKAQSDDDLGFSGAGFSRVEFHHPEATDVSDELFDFGKPVGIGEIRGISIEGTLDDFCRTLEFGLDRPVVNETNLKGTYEFDLKAGAGGDNDFLARLRDQFDLSITPGQRRVQMVVLKPR